MEFKRIMPVNSVICRFLFGFFLLIILMFGMIFSAHAAAILYAMPTATGLADCSGWTNACTLQTALTQAVTGDEIWVATGVHYPGTTREESFSMNNGVTVYGGIAGIEPQRDQRDWQANLTVLSRYVDLNDVNEDF